MASNILIKFADIVGESKQTGYTEWVECASFSFGAHAPVSIGGTGLGSGKASLSGYQISAHFGAHSHELLEKMLNGKHHATIELALLKQTGDATGQKYWSLKAQKGYIESLSWNAGPDGELYENIVFQPETHEWEYLRQNTEDGTLASTGAKTYNVQEAQTS
jgi:type VI protein secretion system component Hcp